MRNLRDAFRRLLHDRVFAAVAIVTLGLGIGANTAIFSLIKTVMLRPLPYGQQDRLVMIWNGSDRGSMTWLSASEVMSYRSEVPALAVGGYIEADGNFTGGQEPERVRVAAVTADLFDILQAQPMLGRGFVAADAREGSDDALVLAHGLWLRRFGGDPAVLGRHVELNGRRRVVVGVMPEGFKLPLDFRNDRQTEAWAPMIIEAPGLRGWGNRSLIGVARLRDGASHDTANAQMHAAWKNWVRAGYVQDSGDGRVNNRRAMPLVDHVLGDVSRTLWVLLGTVAVVLLMAIANVVNLLVARAGARRQEAAIRAALGAGRAGLVRQMLVESVTLALAGAVCGVAIAWAGLRLLVALRPSNLPRAGEAGLDGGVLLFAAGLAILTGILFGLAPALNFSRANLTSALRDGGRAGTHGRGRTFMRRALIASQVAMSLVLVIAAVLLARSLTALTSIDTGFDTRNVLTAHLQLPVAAYRDAPQIIGFYRQLTERVKQMPGVESAGAVRIIPLTRTIGDWSITIEGKPFTPADNPNGDWQIATPGYFETLGVKPLQGRLLAESDREDGQPVVVINDTMAQRYWPEGALGKRFHLSTDPRPWMTIVGIVPTVRHNKLVEEPRAEMYVPHAQWHLQTGGAAPRGMAIVMKTSGNPLALVDGVKSAVRSLDPNLPLADIQSMEQVMGRALSQPRFTATLLMVFAFLALTLASVGIYGMVSLLVSERSQEIGIRMALGAERRSILAMVLRQSALTAALGIAGGLAAAFALAPLLENLLYGVGPLDPATFGAVPVLLMAIAMIGSLAPARRASNVDPIITLRR